MKNENMKMFNKIWIVLLGKKMIEKFVGKWFCKKMVI